MMRYGLLLVVLGLLLSACTPSKQPGQLPAYDYAPSQEPNQAANMGQGMITPLN